MMELNAVISSVIEFIVTLISIPGNLLIIAVYARKKRSSYSVLVTGLGIIDLLLTMSSPVRLYNFFYFGKHTSDTFCIAAGSMFYLGLNSSIFMAALISFNRYFTICKPYNYKLSGRASAFSVAITLGASVLATGPLGSMFEVVSYPDNYSDCSIPKKYHLRAATYVYILTVIHILTIISTLTMYIFVLKRVRNLGKVNVNALSTSSSARQTSWMKWSGENTEMKGSVVQKQHAKIKVLNITSTTVANDAVPTAVSRLDVNKLGPSTSKGTSNTNTSMAIIGPVPQASIPETTQQRPLPMDAPGRNGQFLRQEATRRHLIILMLLYLTLWLPNLFVNILGYKPELRGTNYTAFTVLMVVSRLSMLNRIYHFVISLLFHKVFRRDCKELLIRLKKKMLCQQTY